MSRKDILEADADAAVEAARARLRGESRFEQPQRPQPAEPFVIEGGAYSWHQRDGKLTLFVDGIDVGKAIESRLRSRESHHPRYYFGHVRIEVEQGDAPQDPPERRPVHYGIVRPGPGDVTVLRHVEHYPHYFVYAQVTFSDREGNRLTAFLTDVTAETLLRSLVAFLGYDRAKRVLNDAPIFW